MTFSTNPVDGHARSSTRKECSSNGPNYKRAALSSSAWPTTDSRRWWQHDQPHSRNVWRKDYVTGYPRCSGVVEETMGGKNRHRTAGTFVALQRDDEAAEGAIREGWNGALWLSGKLDSQHGN